MNWYLVWYVIVFLVQIVMESTITTRNQTHQCKKVKVSQHRFALQNLNIVWFDRDRYRTRMTVCVSGKLFVRYLVKCTSFLPSQQIDSLSKQNSAHQKYKMKFLLKLFQKFQWFFKGSNNQMGMKHITKVHFIFPVVNIRNLTDS